MDDQRREDRRPDCRSSSGFRCVTSQLFAQFRLVPERIVRERIGRHGVAGGTGVRIFLRLAAIDRRRLGELGAAARCAG